MILDFSSEFFSWVRGALLILAVYHFMIFFQNRKKYYLYYSLYLVFFFLYFLKDVVPQAYSSIYIYINYSVQLLGYASYVAFARELLNSKKYIPDWDILIQFEKWLFVGLSVVFVFVQLIFNYSYQEKLWLMVTPILTVFTLLTYIVLTKIKGKHVRYFIIGSLTYVILANISLLGPYVLGEEYFYDHGIEPMFFTYLGAILETTMFALIMGYKLKLTSEKASQAKMELELKKKEMSDLKMTILQTQMDPHFLYNSLNSINNFVLKNDKEIASDYITKFARLIREILKYSSSLTIPLEDELGVLGLYVKLEQMRMPGGFDYVVTIDDTIDLKDIEVPPLFLQPFVENAIWHGFANKEGYKKITLSLHDEEDKIRCEIIDNGVGIANTNENPEKINSTRKPFGLKASEDRIKLLHENKNVYVIIEDISQGINTGTKVTIKFPKSI